MQSQTQHLSIRDRDQSRGVPPRACHPEGPDWRPRGEGLEFLNHDRHGPLVGVVRDRVDGFYDFPVVGTDEENVVCFTTRGLHLGVYGDLCKPVAGERVFKLL